MKASAMEFFRHCPGCGRRFHIKLEDKKLAHYEKKIIPTKRAISPGAYTRPNAATGKWQAGYTPPTIGTVLIEGKPIILEEKDFEYTYRCGHCGHEWTEHHQEERREH